MKRSFPNSVDKLPMHILAASALLHPHTQSEICPWLVITPRSSYSPTETSLSLSLCPLLNKGQITSLINLKRLIKPQMMLLVVCMKLGAPINVIDVSFCRRLNKTTTRHCLHCLGFIDDNDFINNIISFYHATPISSAWLRSWIEFCLNCLFVSLILVLISFQVLLSVSLLVLRLSLSLQWPGKPILRFELNC